MKAEELRLGNWVHTGDNQAVQVAAIFYDEVYLDFNGNQGGILQCDIEKLKPIEIDENWLIESGFLDWKNGWWSKGAMKYYAYINSFYWKETSIHFGDVKYVHEFQNIVYFLSKEELKDI
jgi:hypothetical protein